MKQRILWLILSIFPVFYLIFLFFQFLQHKLSPGNTELLNYLFLSLSGVSLLMLTNLLLVKLIKPYYTGITFMAWSMIKLMFIMGFFAVLIMPEDIRLSNEFIFVLMLTYLAYLGYELVFTLFLLQD